MFEIALYYLGVVVVAGLVLAFLQAIAKNLWLTFKWNVLRMPPRILDEKIVTETVEECAKMQAEYDIPQLELQGLQLTQEDKGIYHDRVKQSMRSVIEVYIDRFTRRH